LAVATRYFLVWLLPVLLAVDGLILRRPAAPGHAPAGRRPWVGAAAGLTAAAAGFALSTPYFFLDYATAKQNLLFEARSAHVGADGLSPIGNLTWYLTQAIPASLTWPVAILAALGAARVVANRRPQGLLLLGFAALFLSGISLSPLHWQRWIIPVVPVLALVAADALLALTRRLRRMAPGPRPRLVDRAALFLLLCVVSAWPLYDLALLGLGGSRPSTRVAARSWIVDHLPPGSRVAADSFTLSLPEGHFDFWDRNALAKMGSLDDFRRSGYRYFVVNDTVWYRPYLGEADRYRREADFYRRLSAEGQLIQQFAPPALCAFEPATFCGGPVIRIYELPGS
jgi:hypothetical protein